MKRMAQMRANFSGKTGLNTAIGAPELCAWQPVRGIVWVQTRDLGHARRLAKRSDSRLVVRGVGGGYLKTFEFRRSLAWAVRLMNRYMSAEMSANARMGRAVGPVAGQASRLGAGQRANGPTLWET
jgi:hypothetical protein